MTASFPPPYEDELLVSLCARYARLMGYGSLRSTLSDLFGRETIKVAAELPTYVSALAERLELLGGPSAEELIDHHTQLPYYAAFHPVARREAARTAMLDQGQPYWLLGLQSNRGPTLDTLRYCPACAAEERTQGREAYWHRLHQLPGVLACLEHGVQLEVSTIKLPLSDNGAFLFAAETTIPRNESPQQLPPGCELNLVLDLARRTRDALSGPPVGLEPSALYQRYLSTLTDCGLATHSGRVRIKALRAAFLEFYPPEVLDQLGVDIDNDGWLLRLLRKPRTAAHTLHHLLLQALLNLDRDSLATPKQIFGAGPWPCLNRASQHYGERRITDAWVDYTCNARQPIGTFACSCGFAYRRVGPDLTPEDAFRYDRMVMYGPVWSHELRRGWLDPSLSLRELSRRLGFDPQTLRRQAKRLGLARQRSGSREQTAVISEPKASLDFTFAQLREAYRNAWLKARHDQPYATVRTLAKQSSGVYAWLRKYDRDWYEEHKPARPASWPSPTPGEPRVPWEQRDIALAHELHQAACRLLIQEPLVRVTHSHLARAVGEKSLLFSKLDKLPKCSQTIAEYAETREAFAVRRINAAAARVRQSGEQVPRWRFIQMAGLQPASAAKYAEVEQALERAWTEVTTQWGTSDV